MGCFKCFYVFQERVNAGYPSVMCVSVVIAIGTSNGLVLVFDEKQTLRWCHQVEAEQSSASALSFNSDCTRLLTGYACGTILMFDAADGRVLRTMSDAHTPCTAVLHLKVCIAYRVYVIVFDIAEYELATPGC